MSDFAVYENGCVLTLPLPHQMLHPNHSTGNWKWKAALRKRARADAATAARLHVPAGCPFGRASIQATFYLARKNDEDNLCAWLKAYLDGLADAGIVANDSAFTIQTPVTQITGRKVTKRVVLTITAITENSQNVTGEQERAAP